MRNKIIFFSALLLLLLLNARAFAVPERIQILTRIHSVSATSVAITPGQAPMVNFVPARKEVAEALAQLERDDEALLSGHVRYDTQKEDSRLITTFVIEEVRPVSLRRLGMAAQGTKLREEQLTFTQAQVPFAPAGIPIKDSVFASMTITASLLMLNTLTGPKNEPAVTQSLRTGVLFSAGALATGLFIWEQLQGKWD
jgi:hypothetical protein